MAVIFGHPSNHMQPDAQVHIHEGLHVYFVSTQMHLDDLEACCLS
jgi:hypothetical protein